MNINGNSRFGIYKYDASVEFEAGDLVLDDILYYTEANSIGNKPSESPDLFTPYATKYAQATSLGNDRLVTVNELMSTLSSYLGGINLSSQGVGQVMTSDFNILEINQIFDTQVRFFRGGNMFAIYAGQEAAQDYVGEVGNTLKLFRSYKSGNSTYQEILELSVGALFYRTSSGTTWGKWKMVPAKSTEAMLSLLQGQYARYQEEVTKFTTRLNTINNNLDNFYSYFRANKVSTLQSDNSKFILDISSKTIRLSSLYVSLGGILTLFYTTQNGKVQNSISFSPKVGSNSTDSEVADANGTRIKISSTSTYTDMVASSPDSTFEIIDVIYSKPAKLIANG